MGFNKAGEIVQVHQAHGNGGTLGLVAGFAGEASGGKIDATVSGAKGSEETADLRCPDHRILAVLYLAFEPWLLQAEAIGRGKHGRPKAVILGHRIHAYF
jgi:hypothetical protein